MVATAVVGSTGLVGSNILSTLLTHPTPTTVSAFSRKPLQVSDPHSRLRPLTNSDSSAWPPEYSSISPTPTVFFSALGATRAQAGGVAKQREIDLDLNVALAKAAKAAGCRVYVLISVYGANSASMVPYTKMKGQLDEAVSDIGFEKVVLIKPGLIVGSRSDSRPAEYMTRCLANGMGKVSGNKLKDFWAQDADVIGKAAVSAGLRCLDGSAPEGKVWTVSMGDIVKLGRTEATT
ncbi:MAG: Protein fmp52, mitochondrial [Chrysothrix sp. TS-e1954]|nr:MAG: Protein fmp52, mitochondrial [Chrysothrix sp. TS-e1954]